MRLIFARHGESEANVSRVISNLGSPHPVTANGRSQAERLAEDLRGSRVDAVLASPIRRAAETGRILGDRMSVPVRGESGLAEHALGELEGRGDDEAWGRLSLLEQQWAAGNARAHIAGGENLLDIRARMRSLVVRVATGMGFAGDRAVVLVSHGGFLQWGLPHVLTNVTPKFARSRPLGYATCVETEWLDGVLVCLRWAGGPPPD